jgi:AcrR family transcriptional regulator
MRRGFDEPAGERRDVDTTRERIVLSSLALHKELGIQATTWPKIAGRAGVPVETVEAYFPTLDDLIAGCGEHFLRSLGLPPPDRAAEVFEGAASAPERARRLVATLFAAYEREAAGLEAGRRERARLPVLDECLSQLDLALDALVAEALGPRADAESVAAVRALTDVPAWRELRDQGASPAAAVEQAGAAVERWYRRYARTAIRDLVERESGRLGVRPGALAVRDPRSRWGSCSSRGTLSFSWRLVVPPPAVLRYVVVHELCHLAQQNHSRAFWRLVDEALPDWHDAAGWLRSHGGELSAYRPQLGEAS